MNRPFEVKNVEICRQELTFNSTFSSSAGDLETRDLATIELTTPEGTLRGEFPSLDLPGYETPSTQAVIAAAESSVQKLVGHSVNSHDIENLEVFDAPVKLGIQSALVMGASAVEPTGSYKPVKASAVISAGESLGKMSELAELGYSRFKIKVSPDTDVAWLSSVISNFPDHQIDIDANGSFTAADLPAAIHLLMAGVTVFEQPFNPRETNCLEAQQLAACMKEGQFISVDESAADLDLTMQAFRDGAINAVCVKPFRYGGVSTTLETAKQLSEAGLEVQLGGMLEAGAGRTLLALIQGELDLRLIGDISPASYLYADQPFDDLKLVDGELKLT